MTARIARSGYEAFFQRIGRQTGAGENGGWQLIAVVHCCGERGLIPPFETVTDGTDNHRMNIRGRVRNGVVELEPGSSLPEGLEVTVSCPDAEAVESAVENRRVRLPLVPSRHPGSFNLTTERVAELLEEADVSA